MTWQIIVALFIAIPVILLPVVIVGYLNSRHVFQFVRDLKARRAALARNEGQVAVTEGEEKR